MTKVLGISGFYHDSAAALAIDGRVVAAGQEERFSRKKHDPRFPRHAVDYCLEEAFIDGDELDAVVFYDNPLLTLDRALASLLHGRSRGVDVDDQWPTIAGSLLGEKLFFADYVRQELFADVPVLFTRHHHSHAASAFYPSPFQDAAILTLDGVGEWATTSISHSHDGGITDLVEIEYPHSLGLLYSALTFFTGFKVNSGEYKLMGLAPYGEPVYADVIRDNLIEVKADGSYRLDMTYFDYVAGSQMTNDKFSALFGGPPRAPESRISRREMDLAASIQQVTEEVVLGLARHAKEITGSTAICLAGGVALNCVANGVLLRTDLFDDMWIQPASGDAGGAIGSALAASYEHFSVERVIETPADSQAGSLLGPSYSEPEVREYLDQFGAAYRVVDDRAERADVIAEALDDGKVVGHFAGRAEFGPRALGGRSILGDPRNADTQVNMNLKIKYRESFRPFAPAVLAERVSDYFDIDSDSPYMLIVAPVRADRRTTPDGEAAVAAEVDDADDLLKVVAQRRSDIPAITHVDYSARIQTVDAHSNQGFRELIEAFEARTGCGVVVNTSFNVRGEPIVGTPADAYRCFMRTEMDMLVVENFVLVKEEQPDWAADESWKDEYELD